MCENAQVNGVTKDGGCKHYCLVHHPDVLPVLIPLAPVLSLSRGPTVGEYASLWSNAAVKIPDDVDAAEAAPLLCAGVTVFNGIRNMNVTAGDVVAIQGLGGLGHLAVQYSRKMGYNTVAISSSDAKKEFATKLGANHYIDTSKQDAAEELQKLGGASLVVITAPNPKIMGPMVNACGPLGKVLILAREWSWHPYSCFMFLTLADLGMKLLFCHSPRTAVGDVPVPSVSMIMKGISVHGWPSGHALDSEEAIAFAQNQGVKCMVEKVKLEDVEGAVKSMEDGKVRFRGVIVF